MPEFITVKEAAYQLNVSPQTIRNLIKDGHIKAKKITPDKRNSPLRISKNSFNKFLLTYEY